MQDWASIQDICLCWIVHCQTGCRWMIALVLKMWQVAWDLWVHRNEVKHSPQAESAIQQELRHSTLHMEFHLGPAGLPAMYQFRFAGHIADLLRSTPVYQQQWLDSINAGLACQIQRSEQAYLME